MQADKNRIERDIEALGACNETPGNGLTRFSYTPEYAKARDYVVAQMEQAGLQVRMDAVGNLFGRRPGTDDSLPVIAMGSHLDSVRNGGKYDGGAGVVAALEVARLLHGENAQLRHPFEVVAIVEEEGGRFAMGMFGGKTMAGLTKPEDLERLKDADGVTIREAMEGFGLKPDTLAQAKREDIMAFLELHIEQGPVLETEGLPVGIVDSIVGIRVRDVVITGQPGHAGTTPMNLRKDALVAAAEVVGSMSRWAGEQNGAIVSTVGKMQVEPGAINVIPGKVTFTVGMRSGSSRQLDALEDKLKALLEDIRSRGYQVEYGCFMDLPPVEMSADIIGRMQQVAGEQDIPCRVMSSGAGHDAMYVAHVAPTAMIFVPSKEGRSHCPEEYTDCGHIATGCDLLLGTVKSLDTK